MISPTSEPSDRVEGEAIQTAIVAVHGVCPHPQYEIQDAVAIGLCDSLNRRKYQNLSWKIDILWPRTRGSGPAKPEDLQASALRVHVDGDDDPDKQRHDVFDVFEAYWSPLDKNQTTPPQVLSWLVRSLFQPLNGYAALWAGKSKIAFDLGYLAVALILIAGFFGLFFFLLGQTWSSYACRALNLPPTCSAPSVWQVISNPLEAARSLGSRPLLVLLVAVIGSYSLLNVGASLFADLRGAINRRTQVLGNAAGTAGGKHTGWRHFFQAGLLAVAALCFYAIATQLPILPKPKVFAFGPSVYLVLTLGTLKGAIAFVQQFLVNFLGDVQIYCSQDENARFFAFRTKIVQTVVGVILNVLQSKPSAPAGAASTKKAYQYDRVFVAAHSLGSTIAMDAIMQVHELAEEGGVDEDAWRKLCGFITFGTSLEKTRFFFDVRNPSFTQFVRDTRDDVYGHLFTPLPPGRQPPGGGSFPGIYWSNYWYVTDLVANEIASYRSSVAPRQQPICATGGAGRLVCSNARLPSRFSLSHIWVHGDYISDGAFWDSGTDKTGNSYIGAGNLIAP